MVAQLLAALQKIDIEPTAEEVADVLWLALQLGAPDSPAKEESPSQEPKPSETKQPAPLSVPSDTDLPRSQPKRNPANPTSAETDLFSSAGQDKGEAANVSALAFRSPTASALPCRRDLARILRLLKWHIPSRTRQVIDVDATVTRIAEERIWSPVQRPERTRWLEIALVADHSDSMVIWQQTIGELARLIAYHEAFRTVHTWSLHSDALDGKLHLYAGLGPQALQRRPHRPAELIDPTGRRLILLISDCISEGWQSGEIATKLLAAWTRHNPVALIQVLPQQLWQRTAMHTTESVALRTRSRGDANRFLQAKYLRRRSRNNPVAPHLIRLPVVTLEPGMLKAWIQMLAGRDKAWAPGIVLPPLSPQSREDVPASTVSGEPPRPDTPDNLVREFIATASPPARKLAAYLATVSLTLPIMRLVQQRMLPNSRQVHLAEVFLSGLLRQEKADQQNPDTKADQQNLDKVEYEFVAGVRELLLNTITRSETDQVIRQVSEYIQRETGASFGFSALLADPTGAGTLNITPGSRRFARVLATTLRRLGGEYTQIAERLEQQWGRESGSSHAHQA